MVVGFSCGYLLFRAPRVVLGDVVELVASARPEPGPDRIAVRLAPGLVNAEHHALALYAAAGGDAAGLPIREGELDDIRARYGEGAISLLDMFKESVRLAGKSIAEHAAQAPAPEPQPDPVLPPGGGSQLDADGLNPDTHALAAWLSRRFGSALFVCSEPFSRIGGSAAYLNGAQQTLRFGEEHYGAEPDRAVAEYTGVVALGCRGLCQELEADDDRAPMMLIAEGGRYLDGPRRLRGDEQRGFSVCL